MNVRSHATPTTITLHQSFIPPRLLPSILRRARPCPIHSCANRRPTDWASRKPPPRARRPTEDQVVSRITACARRRDWYAARCAWLMYLEHDEPSARLVGAYVNALCRGARLDDAYKLLDMHPELDGPVARTSVIGALTRSGRVDEGMQELRHCMERGFDMSAPNGWTAVIHGYGVEGRAAEAAEVLEEAIACDVRVDAEMYDAVIRAYGRVGKLKDAFGVLGRLRANGLRPTDCTFEGLIYACAHAGEGIGLGRRAFVIFDAAKEEGKASVRVVNAVASAVLKAGMRGEGRAMELLKEMESIWGEIGEGVWELGVDAERFEKKLKNLRRLVKKEKDAMRIEREFEERTGGEIESNKLTRRMRRMNFEGERS